jgi:4-hydroxybenzoate polyprenyltransferase
MIKEDSNSFSFQQLNLYLKSARFDHWSKQVFLLPGVIFSFLIAQDYENFSFFKLCLGFLSVSLVASSNYIINETLDAKYDKFHPKKKSRALVKVKHNYFVVALFYFTFLFTGLMIADQFNMQFTITSFVFATMGLIYNIPPIRAKDIPFVDVVIESFNNPLRLLLGWSLFATSSLPPLSLMVGYWFAGAFLMTVKRYSEYLYFKNANEMKSLFKYRAAFRFYNEARLSMAALFYAFMSLSMGTIFLVKYRIEYIFILPFIVLLFSYYFHLSQQNDSIVQTPEKLYQDRFLRLIILANVIVFIAATSINIPYLNKIISSKAVSHDVFIQTITNKVETGSKK